MHSHEQSSKIPKPGSWEEHRKGTEGNGKYMLAMKEVPRAPAHGWLAEGAGPPGELLRHLDSPGSAAPLF